MKATDQTAQQHTPTQAPRPTAPLPQPALDAIARLTRALRPAGAK